MDDAITSVVADTKINTGMTFADIFCGNQPPKSVAKVNPVLPIQKNPTTHKNQVAWFTPAWWNLYFDICVKYHSTFVTWLLDSASGANTTLVVNYNTGVTSSSLKGYYGKFHMWFNDNGMVNLLSISCLEEEEYHIQYAINKEWVVTKPQGVVIPFKRNTSLTKGVSYIDMME